MDALCPRKVPEPTRFPSGFFEPCVPDASLVFGNGIFDAPKQAPQEEKLSYGSKNTDGTTYGNGESSSLPLWAKAYGLGRNAAVNTDKENVGPVPQEKCFEKIGNRVLNSLDINSEAVTVTAKLADKPKYGYGLQSSKTESPRMSVTVRDSNLDSMNVPLKSSISEREENVKCVIADDVPSVPLKRISREPSESKVSEFLSTSCAEEDNIDNIPFTSNRNGETLNVAPAKERFCTNEFSTEKNASDVSSEISLKRSREKSTVYPKKNRKETKIPVSHQETETLSSKPPFSCDTSQSTLSDPLIRALFHLQNQHTELLQQLTAEVKAMGQKQKKMFGVFQKLCGVLSSSSHRQTAPDKPPASCDKTVSSNDATGVDKCTQTLPSEEKVVQASSDASTETEGVGWRDRLGECKGTAEQGEDSEKTGTEYHREDNVERGRAQSLHRTTHKTGRSDTSKARTEEEKTTATKDRRGPAAYMEPAATCVGGLPRTAQDTVSRSESRVIKMKPTSKEKDVIFSKIETVCTPSEEVDPHRQKSQQDVNGLIKTMRNLASRYKNSEFIKVPDLEDVAEATENSSDSEESSSSEGMDESLTIGDLSLVPQNVSLTPNHSVHIDSRGLEISCDSIASESSDDSEREGSGHHTEGNLQGSEKTDKSTIYLYKNIMSKVQKILEHNKTASDIRRNSLETKTCSPKEGSPRSQTRAH